MATVIRPAVAGDALSAVRLIRREVARGTVLPHTFHLAEFLVAEEDGVVVGTLSLSSWTAGVIELGTVIAAEPGRGVGQALVAAGLEEARERGAHTAVVLTGVPGWFSRQGFTAIGDTPWARARGLRVLQPAQDELGVAVSKKAAASCRGCARLGGCSQALLTVDLRPAVAVPVAA